MTAENHRQNAIEKIVFHSMREPDESGQILTVGDLVKFAKHPVYGDQVAGIPVREIFHEYDRVRPCQEGQSSGIVPENDSDCENTDMSNTTETPSTTETPVKRTRKPRVALSESDVASLCQQATDALRAAGGTAPKKDIMTAMSVDETSIDAALQALKTSGKVTVKKGRKAAWTLV